MSIEQVMEEFEEIKKKFEAEFGMKMEVPPNSFKEMNGEFIEVDGNRKLKIRFPYDARFTNPIGIFQGECCVPPLTTRLARSHILRSSGRQ